MFRTAPGWLSAGFSALARVGACALDVIYPPSCLVCRRAVDQPDGLCWSCWREMRWIEQPICDRLGAPLGEEFLIEPDGRRISPMAKVRPPVFSRVRAVALFGDGPARRLVHRLKYGDRDELARPMGRWMARAGADVLGDADLLVPIPLHWTRLARRRYNQAGALAAAASREAGAPVAHGLLRRARATATQTDLPPQLRARNLEKAFTLAQKPGCAAIAGQNIVLIDDVMTTGATLNAAATTLLRAGAARVDALVFAIAIREVCAPPIADAISPF